MTDPAAYRVLADGVLVAHAAIAVFVVGGLGAIVAGNLRGWRWVNGFGFRVAHLAAVLVIAAQAWLGELCPLTTLENWLRGRAGESAYGGGFIAHWVARLLYYDAPLWLFTLVYTAFASGVAAAWWRWPPHRNGPGH